MSVTYIQTIDDAVASIDTLTRNLRRDRSRQVRSHAERTIVTATAQAWFHSHRPRLEEACAPDLLNTVGSSFAKLLEFADRNTTRDRYLDELKIVRKQLIALRSGTLKTPAVARPPVPDFSPLIQDARMRAIIERRWNETAACLRVNAHLAATVMIGGLLEGLLLARTNRVQPQAPIFTAKTAPKDKTGKTLQLKEWMLKDFIDVAHELKWISRSAKDVSAVVRDYRNYIHPQKEYTHGIVLDNAETAVLWSVFDALARQLIESVTLPI